MAGFFKRPKATVSIVLSKDTVRLGEELTGTVHVTSEEEFDADELRIPWRFHGGCHYWIFIEHF